MSIDAYYFPHDTNAIQDPKMMTLLFQCGLRGVAMYWIIIEILHTQESLTMDEFRKYIQFYCKFESSGEHLIKSIEESLLESNLLKLENEKIYSVRVNKNMQFRKEKTIKATELANRRWKGNAKAMPRQCQGNAIKGKERKGKDIYVDQSSDWYKTLFTDFPGIDIETEYKKAMLWEKDNHRKDHKKFFKNWLLNAKPSKPKTLELG